MSDLLGPATLNDPDASKATRVEFTQRTECVDPFVFTVDLAGCFTIGETEHGKVVEAFHGCDLDGMIAMLSELRERRDAIWTSASRTGGNPPL